MKTLFASLTFMIAIMQGASANAQALDSLQIGQKALHSMAGCYLVDFSYAETQSLKAGYAIDGRVYDVNRDKSVKEYIYIDDISPTRLHLQHVLFATGLDGQLMEGSQLKHTGEDWDFQAPFLYDFTAANTWAVKDIRSTNAGQWTRKITNLDDGLRYQCSAPFLATTAYPEWTCSNYAPIPGRETRDMGRKDYDALERTTRLVAYGNSFLERQDNTKVIDRTGGPHVSLAKETGKNWYVRLPDSECQAGRDFAQPRHDFWVVEREAWDQILIGDRPFVEKPASPGTPSRYYQMSELEETTLDQKANLADPSVRSGVAAQITKIIQDFRAN
jgi:hypothetical protein